MKITFKDLEDLKCPSVTDYCRLLVKENDEWCMGGGPGKLRGEPELPSTIEVYRGDMLCLTVTDVRKAATIMPTGIGWKVYDRRRS